VCVCVCACVCVFSLLDLPLIHEVFPAAELIPRNVSCEEE